MYTNPILKSLPAENPDSPSCQLGRSLDSERDAIIHEWLGRVLSDPAIPTDSLSMDQVGFHFPGLLHDLTETLLHERSNGDPDVSGGDDWQYGAARWQQGFLLPEMLRELTHLRSIVIERVVRLEDANREFGTMQMLLATDTVHRFVDRIGIAAITHFLIEGVHEREMVTAAA